MIMHNESNTRERLLDAAEKLFAKNGIGATSLRAVTGEAGANLASIHYHFGSKEALLVEVFARRINPINEQRSRMLKHASTETPGDLDAIIRAFVEPALRLLSHPELGGRHMMMMMGRLHTEPVKIKLKVLHLMEEISQSFTQAIGTCAPHLDQTELFWRFHFMIGSMALAMASSDIIKARAGDLIDVDNVDANVAQLVRFVSGGFAAPAGHSSDHKEEQGEE